MANKDYYNTLGVDKSASKDEIKKAYKKLAKKYHPDISKEADAEKKFKEVNEAADVLLDDNKKQKYDAYGSADGPDFRGGQGGFSSGFSGFGGGMNMEDIFEQFGFGGFGGGSQGHNQQRDTSIEAQIEISLEDVYFGVEKTIKINREEKCKTCDGKGAKSSNDIKNCNVCNGSGVETVLQRSILGTIRTQRVCSKCHGKGKEIKNPCSTCSGKGTTKIKSEINVKIPKGVENGVTLRVSQKGSFNIDTNKYDDLYLKIFIKKDKNFDVDEANLYMDLDINFIQAILGDEVEFKHFKKTLSLKIPEGTQAGTILRLKGKGLPYFNYNSYGDLYVKVNVEIPKSTTSKQKNILMDYAKTLKDKGFMDRLKSLFK